MTPGEAARAARNAQRVSLAERTALMRSTRERIVALLNHALEEIRVTLAGAPSDYQLWSLPDLAAEIRQSLEVFQTEAGATMSTAAGSAWTAGAASIERPLTATGTRGSTALPMLDNRQLLAMRHFMVERIKDIGVQAAARITNELGLVVTGIQSPSEAITNTTRILGEPSRTRATTIVRTELGRTFAVASYERLAQAAETVPGMKKQWRKSGKIHPRLHHELADGQVREVGEPFVLAGGKVKMMYPHDPKAPAKEVINCGCVMLAWKADWKMSRRGKAPGGRFGDDAVPVREILDAAAYREAKAGGKHHGMLENYASLPANILRKAERSYTRQIALHQAWIDNPALKIKDPAADPVLVGRMVETKWPQDIDRNERERAIIRGLLALKEKDK